MSPQENTALVREQLENVTTGKIDAAVAAFAPGAINHGRPADPEIIKLIFADIHDALGEKFTLDEVIAVDDHVVIRATVNGTHQGVVRSPVNGGLLMGVPPTGRSYTVQHIHIFRLAGSKVVEHWANRDDLAMMQQLGLVPEPAPFNGVLQGR
ncbi:MAG: ester cyclase [Chloroflexota bacterium]|nr:ester cyclase [Chloroflexota bacterium]